MVDEQLGQKPESTRTEAAYCWNAQQLQQYNATFFELRAMMMTFR